MVQHTFNRPLRVLHPQIKSSYTQQRTETPARLPILKPLVKRG